MYVTFQSWALYKDVKAFEGLYYFGCNEAKGSTELNDVIAKIWAPFASKSISVSKFGRPGTNILTYYKNVDPSITSYEIYQKYPHDGECGAFSDLFESIFLRQGIEMSTKTITSVNGSELFLVKNWKFGISNNTDNSTKEMYPYTNEVKNDVSSSYIRLDGYKYNWKIPVVSVTDSNGISGQGNISNPYSDFQNHIVNSFGEKIYDPSYGKMYNSLREWEEQSIEAFYIFRTERNTSTGQRRYYLHIRKNELNIEDVK